LNAVNCEIRLSTSTLLVVMSRPDNPTTLGVTHGEHRVLPHTNCVLIEESKRNQLSFWWDERSKKSLSIEITKTMINFCCCLVVNATSLTAHITHWSALVMSHCSWWQSNAIYTYNKQTRHYTICSGTTHGIHDLGA
jgi:hypothetical protein